MNLVLKFGSKMLIMIFGHLSEIAFANETIIERCFKTN